jgi:hypothetical protein
MEPVRRDAEALWDFFNQKSPKPKNERLRLVVITDSDGSEHVTCKKVKDLSILDTIKAMFGGGNASFRNVCRVCSKLGVKDDESLFRLDELVKNYNANHWLPGKIVDSDLQKKLQIDSIKASLTLAQSRDVFTADERAGIKAEIDLLDQLRENKPIEVNNAAAKRLWHDSITSNFTEVVKDLLRNNINPNVLIAEKPALSLAFYYGSHEVAQILLEDKRTDISVKDAWKATVLMNACSGIDQYLESVRLLLKRGADVNAQDEYGETALMKACRRGHNDIIRELLKAGANRSIKDREGHVALDLALPDETKRLFLE